MTAAPDVGHVEQTRALLHTTGRSQTRPTAVPHRCGHRRRHPLIRATFSAALLVIALGVGLRAGNALATSDAADRVATIATCTAPELERVVSG